MGRKDSKILVILPSLLVSGVVLFWPNPQVRGVAVLDENGRRLQEVFDGLQASFRLASDQSLLKPVRRSPCASVGRPLNISERRPWGDRLRSWLNGGLSTQTVRADDCPTCSGPQDCFDYYITCISVPCPLECQGSFNYCYTDWSAPAWRGRCVTSQIVCSPCELCLENTCWNG